MGAWFPATSMVYPNKNAPKTHVYARKIRGKHIRTVYVMTALHYFADCVHPIAILTLNFVPLYQTETILFVVRFFQVNLAILSPHLAFKNRYITAVYISLDNFAQKLPVLSD